MNKENILQRCISGIIIAAIFITAIFVFRPLFYVLSYIVAALMLLEWYNITNKSKACNFLGQLLIPIPIASLLFLSHIDQSGWLLFTFFAIIWSVDIMAMFGGKLIGGPKLAPQISPNKTISGLITGVSFAIIITNIIAYIPSYYIVYDLLNTHFALSLFALIIGLTAQASDLLVSYFKRKFNVKDSGTIIPGHGGMLDRFDSIILTAPLVVLYFIVHL
ncbi:MAG: phosphatidate cytidylyltransferase [Rickettsiaceae bacterium]|nr:phosphatidate cytidylyltransferase [Rickettsiaceae bacterium]MDP4832111.1 phosphatidate cytidylyltransferase [Rickettsiaceae bacterium]MDP5020307.1 phosphatidate cytidylyltransferase [Rickettsiaceae bacterium]MDP5082627.1 phosphatidate cytidylyltransferase [Rickettsiaceae bacterium]